MVAQGRSSGQWWPPAPPLTAYYHVPRGLSVELTKMGVHRLVLTQMGVQGVQSKDLNETHLMSTKAVSPEEDEKTAFSAPTDCREKRCNGRNGHVTVE